MRKLFFATGIFISTIFVAQEIGAFRIGFIWGGQANQSIYSGGMQNADARFHYNDGGGGAFSFLARYDFTNRWAVLSGFGVNGYGFDFALAQNYSLLDPMSHFNTLSVSGAAAEIPLIANYKFNQTCDGKSHSFFGLGYVQTFIGKQVVSKDFKDVEGNNTNTLKANATFKEGLFPMLRFTAGRERILKQGGIIRGEFLWNLGFSELARANVSYSIDGKDYFHEFSNNGNFFGVRFSYFFRPFSVTK